MKQHPDFLILGAGIFGLSTAIELRKRQYRVSIWNPDRIPHHLAASTDISKIVRMEYGSDELYFEMGAKSIEGWKDWNDQFKEKLYHETGLLLLMKAGIEDARQQFEAESYRLCKSHGYATELLGRRDIKERFPIINPQFYPHAHFNPVGGFVESGQTIKVLANYARELGVEVIEGQTASHFSTVNGKVVKVHSREGASQSCGTVLVAAGTYTPFLVPDLRAQMRITGHPVFHVSPRNKTLFQAEKMPVFTADIANSGWYGFGLHPKEGVVKLARHTNGIELHPDFDDRRVSDSEVVNFKSFLKNAFPKAATEPLVYTRRCLYTDTLDGHFWIDYHPELAGLAVASGGSGHGMKMGPVLGPLIADMLEKKDNPHLERFRWRDLHTNTLQEEEARFVEGGKL